MHAWSVGVTQLCFLHTRSGLPFLASIAIGPQLRDASVLILCILTEFVVGFVKIPTEVGTVGIFKELNCNAWLAFRWMLARHVMRER